MSRINKEEKKGDRMLRIFFCIVFVLSFLNRVEAKINISLGPYYSSYLLYMDDEGSKGEWSLGGEVGITGFLPHIGLKLRGSRIRYDTPVESVSYDFEYVPITLCTSFDLLPFVDIHRFALSMETGFGLYLWKGFSDGEMTVLPDGGKMNEKDIGFVGGMTVRLKVNRFIGLEFVTRYNYIASSNIYKYGYFDKDEKIWENGIGVNFKIR